MHFDQPNICNSPWCNALPAMLRHGDILLHLDKGSGRFTATWQANIEGVPAVGTGGTLEEAIEAAVEEDGSKGQSEGRE
jgi:hypothetical protein